MRSEYVKISDIVNELKEWAGMHREELSSLNYITLSGAGEPTLNLKISNLIKELKSTVGVKIAVITNASWLSDPSVRADISGAD